MKFLATFLLVLSLVANNLNPFSLIVKSAFETMEDDTELDTENQQAVDEDSNEKDNIGSSNIKINYTLDLDGYCYIGVPTSYFETIASLTTPTKKCLRYSDKKSKITMSYVTNIGTNADIPGYITKELAGVNTVTNAKHDITVGDNSWTVVPAKEQVEGMNVYVYYILSNSDTTAFWLRVDIDPDSDNDEFNNILTSILNTYDMYYSSTTIFNTPDGGYYKDHKQDNDTVGNTSDYRENDQDYNVYQQTQGFVTADISGNWKDMEMIVDGKKIKLPCSVNTLVNAGFQLNDVNGIGTDYSFPSSYSYETYMTTGDTSIIIRAINESNSKEESLGNLTVVKVVVDLNENSQGSDTSNNNVILPGGITFNIYTNDLVNYYGLPARNESSSEYSSVVKRYTWTSDTKSLIIDIGVVSGIRRVEMRTVQD